MSLTFVQQLESVARRVQRRRWATAVCWALAFITAVVLALIAIDWLLGVYSLVGRLALSALLVTALAAAFAWGRATTRGRPTPLDVALQLQRSHPQYESLLASGLEFSGQEGDDPTAGSAELRRAVVLRASLATETIDLRSAVPRRPLRRAGIAALVAAATLAIPAILAPQGLTTGLARLFNPLGDAQWPREHDLSFVAPPAMVPLGSDFQTTLRDRNGKLPATIEIEFRTRSQGRWQHHRQSYTAAGDKLEVTWPNVQQSFEFRARGGDHKSMPWQPVVAAPAPQLTALELTIHPPPYTREPAEPASSPVRILAGSQVVLRAAMSLPVQSAELQTEGQASIPLKVAGDGRTVSTPEAPWKPTESAEWSFVVTTPAGLVATADRRLSIEVAPDEPPTVEFTAPTADLQVLATAQFEMTARARDDLGIDFINLALTPPAIDGKPAPAIELSNVHPEPRTREFDTSHMVNMATSNPPLGSTWLLVARVRDIAGQSVTSARPLSVRIISREEFARRQEALQARLVSALQRARNHQEVARESTDSWQLDAGPGPGQSFRGAALFQQRAVTTAMSSGAESAASLSDALAAEYGRNVAPEDASREVAERWQSDIHELVESRVVPLEAKLSASARAAGADLATAGSSTAEPLPLQATLTGQDEVLTELDRLIRELSSRGEVQRHQRELAQIKSEQTALHKATEAIGADELREPGKQPTREQRRRRDEVAARQRALATRLATAVSEMRSAADALANQQPEEADRLADAARQAARSPLQSAARQAAEELAAQRFGQAAENQRQTSEQLEKVIAQLEKSRPASMRSKRQIEQLDAALRRLVTSQQAVVDAVVKPRGPSSRLGEQQAAVRNEAVAQAKRIAEFPLFAYALGAAADTMSRVEAQLKNEAIGAAAAPLALQALEQLQQLAAAVRQQRQQQGQPLNPTPPPNPNGNPEQPPKPPNPKAVQALQVAVAQLGLLRTMQATLQGRTTELEQLHAEGKIDDAGLADQSAQLATEQQTLNELAAELVRAVSSAPVEDSPDADAHPSGSQESEQEP